MNKGFTLIEMIVAVAIFGIVSTISISALLSLSNSSRIAQVSRKGIDNIDFIVDDIIREARLSSEYRCIEPGDNGATSAKSCPNGSTALGFNRLDTSEIGTGYVRYSMASSSDGRSIIQKSVTTVAGGAVQSMTSDGVDIKDLKFYVYNAEKTTDNDFAQPRILMTLRAVVSEGKRASTTLNIQTTISQRASNE